MANYGSDSGDIRQRLMYWYFVHHCCRSHCFHLSLCLLLILLLFHLFTHLTHLSPHHVTIANATASTLLTFHLWNLFNWHNKKHHTITDITGMMMITRTILTMGMMIWICSWTTECTLSLHCSHLNYYLTHAGRGLSISYSGNEVIVECLSESAVFVQSVFGNTSQQWHPAAVVKVPPNCAISVFNRQEFFRILEQYIPKGYESVNSLICSCFVRISFVKGWGKNYQRQLVTATPCWIEVKLHGPLQCLDQILKQMGSSRNYCSSTSWVIFFNRHPSFKFIFSPLFSY